MRPISHAMRLAIELARKNGGKLTRFMCPSGWSSDGLEPLRFQENTIQALVDRGLAEYTRWSLGRYKPPVEVTLTAAAKEI